MMIRLVLLALPLFFLTGCSTMSNLSWSSLSPMSWFDSSLQVTDRGVGDVTASTPLTESAINDGLNNNYTLRSGMSLNDGKMYSFFQALDDKTVKMVIGGERNGKVQRIDVVDTEVESAWGVKIGTPFNKVYSKAYLACVKGQGEEAKSIECKAPESQRVSYVFSGIWHGPEELMPSDDILKNWTVSRIVWRVTPQ